MQNFSSLRIRYRRTAGHSASSEDNMAWKSCRGAPDRRSSTDKMPGKSVVTPKITEIQISRLAGKFMSQRPTKKVGRDTMLKKS